MFLHLNQIVSAAAVLWFPMKCEEGYVRRVEVGNRHKLIQTAILVIRVGQIPGGSSTWRLNFLRRCLIFVDPQSKILLHVILVAPRILRWPVDVLSNLFIPVTDCLRCIVRSAELLLGNRHHAGFRNAFYLETKPIN